MMRKTQRVVTLTALLLFFQVDQPTYAQEGATKATIDRAARAVVQVIAKNCLGGGSRTGTGFLWRTAHQVVTALHVISGCRSVWAYYSGVREVVAVPVKALKSADLALLQVPEVPGFIPLSRINNQPEFNSTLQVIGYYFGLRTYDSRPLHVTIGSGVLRDMLPVGMIQSWSNDAGPNVSTRIVRLDGNLVPGLSGAPLIDNSGAVAGIGSGGLDSGAVGISWAVRADYLNNLETASSYGEGYGQPPSRALFSSPEDGESVKTIRCGSALLYRAKSRILKELLAAADDPNGLIRLASTTGMSMLELDNVSFDIYSEPLSGASVAVPSGAVLRASQNDCFAQLADGLRLRISTAPATNPVEVQNQSLAFEARFPAENTGLYWTADPAFTYLAPINRVDGLTVRRKNGIGFVFGGAAVTGDAFETLMYRGTLFVGIEVLNTNYSPLEYQRCLARPADLNCAKVNITFQKWVASVLGVHLSTFPQT